MLSLNVNSLDFSSLLLQEVFETAKENFYFDIEDRLRDLKNGTYPF